MIKKFAKPIKIADVLKKIEKELLRIPEPKNLFYGISAYITKLPYNILIRQHGGEKVKENTNLHQRFVLIINLKAKHSILIGEDLYILASGEGILIFPFQVHTHKIGTEDCLNILITFEMELENNLLLLKNFPFKISGQVSDVVLKMLEVYRQSEDKVTSLSKNTGCWLALLLNMLITEAQCIPLPSLSSSHEVIEKVMNFMGLHLN